MIATLDASAAIELVLNRQHAETIEALLLDAEYVLAPDVYVSEVTNALWKYSRSRAPSTLSTAIVEDAVGIPDDLVESRTLFREAFAMAVEQSHPVYDCLYLVVARRNVATLVTLDGKLASLADRLGVTAFPGRKS